MMGAARALCGRQPGIACILGTGSNSCYYNGMNIISNISPLGYILGDEGSGAVMGKKFMGDLLKNQLPGEIKEQFFSQYPLEPNEIVQKVYKAPFPNRFLAQFTHFIHEHIHEPTLSNLVRNSFIDFFQRNIKQYPEAAHLPVHFTGSIAYYFSSLLKEAAEHTGFRTGVITQSPMEGLLNYHMDN
jgi:N-acetylglucosamine kinase-like BadF-type ATPase